MKLIHQIAFASAATLAAIAAPNLASAAEHIVEMRNKDDAGNKMVFVPGFLKVEPGDTTCEGHRIALRMHPKSSSAAADLDLP